MVQSEPGLILTYQRYTRFWWLIVLGMVIGGSGGWVFSQAQPPMFDARRRITVTIDYTQTGDLIAYNLDMAVGSIQSVFYSSPVLEQVVEKAKEWNNAVTVDSFSKAILMERYGEVWDLGVRDANPSQASQFVNLWAEIGIKALTEAQSHARRAQILRRYLATLEYCLPPPIFEPALPPICQDAYRLDLSAIQVIQERLEKELSQSYAINPALLFSLHAPAEAPVEPVIYARKWLVLAGMLAGFLIIILLIPILPLRTPGEER